MGLSGLVLNKCPECGWTSYDEDPTCENCGLNIDEYEEKQKELYDRTISTPSKSDRRISG